MKTSMASTFVPVDLDKLLDDFEENEEEINPGQLTSSSAENITGGKQLVRRSFLASYPSIEEEEEEVLSDEGSHQRRSDDRTSSDSDSDSVNGVIREAEVITNQSGFPCQAQRSPDVVDEVSAIKLKEDVDEGDSSLGLSLDIDDVYNRIEGSNSRGFDVGVERDVNDIAHAQMLDEESEALNASATAGSLCDSNVNGIALNDVECIHNKENCDAEDVVVSSSQAEDKNNETGDKRHQSNEDNWKPVVSGVPDGTHLGACWSQDQDTFVDTSEPEALNTVVQKIDFAGLNHIPDSQERSVEFTENAASLLGNQVTHDAGIKDYPNDGKCTLDVPKAGITANSSNEGDFDTNVMPMVLINEASHMHSPGHEGYSIGTNAAPWVPLHDQQEDILGDSGKCTSDIPEASDVIMHGTENSQARDSETITASDYYQIDSTPDLSQTACDHDDPDTERSQVNTEAIDADETSVPPSENELDLEQSPDMTIAMHSQGSVEARRITAGEADLGKVPPIWVPDAVATHCMNCGLKFSVIRRRHHCRACGKALCSSCCNMKFLLPYMDNKEGRVCQVCCNALLRAEALMHITDDESVTDHLSTDVDNPLEDSTLDNGLEENDSAPIDDDEEMTEAAEAVPEDSTEGHVVAAATDLTLEETVPTVPPLQLPVLPSPDVLGSPLATPTSPALSDDSDCLFRLDVDNVRSLLPQDTTALPPVLRITNEEVSIQERPDPAEIMYQIKGLQETVVFLLNKNLVVKVSIVKLSCCVKKKCWCFVSEGMGAANQEEMVVLLECLKKEAMIPKDVLSHFNTAFAYAKQGHTVSELGYTIFGQPFLGSSDNAGFLYFKPTYQCLKNLPLPATPYVVGILIKRLETPWAQLFPLRLQLRLGAEYRYYPCPLFSSRSRSAVYGEVGHTIMNLLADFKNFQYTLARVTGLVIHMKEKTTLVRLPQDRYDEVLKILNASDEHVMAMGANFSLKADSHLVCIQSEQGYKTQAINIQNQPRKVTGASFIVFSGALKTSSPFMAKVNIVEDGIMVQLMPEVITKLRNSLKEMKDYTITTGIPGGGAEEQVVIEWVSRQEVPHQASLYSPIDGLLLDGYPSVKVHTGCDFTRKSAFRIQWTEMYFLGDGQQSASRDVNKLTAELAKAFCRTLMPHLSRLSLDGLTNIGLRVNIDSENVGYATGSSQEDLPSNIMSELDDLLVPIIHNAGSHHRRRSLNVELLFKVLRLL
ncbi:zinc finger FYVE domain-containing protein 9-like isoform X1 [Acropora palmata]|uniref:zinc finger FYVE domain-containing protein 9-like isoform X1 n=2 Tax=Acropora palmata TaxID=6131 RepID=UPI003DA12A12